MKISKLNQRNTQINIKPIVTREEADQYSYENIIGDSKMLSESVYGIIFIDTFLPVSAGLFCGKVLRHSLSDFRYCLLRDGKG